jgi:hypothetical protein
VVTFILDLPIMEEVANQTANATVNSTDETVANSTTTEEIVDSEPANRTDALEPAVLEEFVDGVES